MTDLVPSDKHGHDIVPWAVGEKCRFCDYPASHKAEEVTLDNRYHPLTAYLCCDHFWGYCSNSQAPSCPKCRHPWYLHQSEIVLTNKVLFECSAYAGMGDWCGCEELRP